MNITNRKTLFSKDFTLVVIGQIISIFGNQIIRYALPLYLLNKTGSPALFGTIMAVSFIPMLLLFPIGGILADRVNKRNIMVILDFSTAALILAFYMLLEIFDIVPLIAVTMIILFGIQGAYQPTVKASIPILVDDEHNMQANSIVDIIGSLANMIGPVTGGILYSIFGLTPILYVGAACFFASAVMEIFIHIPFEKQKSEGNILSIGLNDLKESFGFMIKKQPFILRVSLIIAFISLFVPPLFFISIPVIVTQHLGFDPDTANRLYGFAQGIIAVGAVLGGLAAGVLSKKLTLKTSPFIFIGMASTILCVGVALHTLSNSMAIYILIAVGGGLIVAMGTLFSIQIISLVQILTPKELGGKVIACVMCVAMCTNPLGQFMYGVVFEKIGTAVYLPFYAAGILVIGLCVFTRRIFYKNNCVDSMKQSAYSSALSNTDMVILNVDLNSGI